MLSPAKHSHNKPTIDQTIRIFDGPESHAAADRLGAYAYSWQGDVYLGNRLGQPGAPSRTAALRHELIHAYQTRNTGPYASEAALETEAEARSGLHPTLAADPDTPHGFWWVVPLGVGLYILLRPKVANAPGPNDPVYESPSDAQIVGEALALFAVPAGVAGALGRLGFGVISSFAITGATTSVAYRGVQDVGSGEFSGVEAYVIDATTGAVIGAVVGGVFRPFIQPATSGAGARAGTQLVHLTSEEGYAGITSSGTLRGSQGIYAVPAHVAQESTALRVARTLLRPGHTRQAIPIPQRALPVFSRPLPVGPVSAYQRLMGVYRAPAGVIDLASGQFTASGSRLANITGQFFPYGADAMIWISGAAIGSRLSPSTSSDYERGLYRPIYNMLGTTAPLPTTQLSDGPFIFLEQRSEGGFGRQERQVPPLFQSPALPSESGMRLPSRMPAIIFVAPLAPQGPTLQQETRR